jgi:hypothetical protein
MLMAWLPICGVVGRWGLVENYWENALEGISGPLSFLPVSLFFLTTIK